MANGPVVSAVRQAIDDLEPLAGRQGSLAQAALRLAEELDESGHENTARELRITMGELFDLKAQTQSNERKDPSGVVSMREAHEKRRLREQQSSAEGA